ncbi:hypothetical protein Q3G72_018654 [Acer saccharum]|nr:hypothetical protein Q3G72_017139 [Acer saccharum]KAK1548367.1 hypothetical protein Q3G72_008105 [Acer saccharum]KAK1548374.1 hypothetical protein Q3G72_018654 [Acer saccharum]
MKTQTYRVAGDEVTIHYVENNDDAVEFTRWALSRGSRPIALDTETTGLNIFSRGFKCRLVQFGDERTAYVLDADRWGPIVADILRRPTRRFVLHNAPFDLLVLDNAGLADLATLGPRVFDTYILAHLMDPRLEAEGGTGLGLKPLSAIYVDPDAPDTSKALYEVFRKEYKCTKVTGWAAIDIDHPLYVLYAGLDVILTSRLLAELGPTTRRLGYSGLAQFEHRVQMITTKMQRRGLRIDVEYTERLSANLKAEAEAQARKAARYGVENVNAPKQVVAGLEAMGESWSTRTATGALSAGKEVLLGLADMDSQWERLDVREPNPLADAVIRSKRATKWDSAYASAFLELRDANDRLHPFIKSLAARTARMSISNPPFQQLPSGDWRVRRAIIPNDGNLIVSVDYAAVEMRVLAGVAGIAKMRDMVAADPIGVDLHLETAKMIYGDQWETFDKPRQKFLRKLMKGVGFGKVYGGGAATLSRQTGLPIADVQSAIQAYDKAYPEIKRYARILQRQAEYGAGEVVTPIGRHLPLDRDRAYSATNYVVQSTARDVFAKALVRLDDAGLTDNLLLPIHDEVLAEFPADSAEEMSRKVADIMSTDFMGVFLATDPEPWPKIPRLFRDIEITEKIDGTNAAIHIVHSPGGEVVDGGMVGALVHGEFYGIAAQSRTRLITPDADNYGFAAYVNANAEALVELLGPGLHFGEWYGKGIQRGYGLDERRFALFNASRWEGLQGAPLAKDLGVDVVPVLFRGHRRLPPRREPDVQGPDRERRQAEGRKVTDIHEAYKAAVLSLREIGSVLAAAVAVHNEPPPGGAARIPGEQARQGVTDPTVDLVLDPRNVEVSRALHGAACELSRLAWAVQQHTRALQAAVDAWEGRRPEPGGYL